ncbi:MAG: hypothetical protein ACI9XJ_001447 [Marivirga sp.]|jgi:hypothetical protein
MTIKKTTITKGFVIACVIERNSVNFFTALVCVSTKQEYCNYAGSSFFQIV